MNKYVDFRSLPVLENSRLRPIVQYIESEDAMLARVSRFVPDCLYSAHVEGAKESSIVNLCDVHGGLVSSFILNSIMNFFSWDISIMQRRSISVEKQHVLLFSTAAQNSCSKAR